LSPNFLNLHCLRLLKKNSNTLVSFKKKKKILILLLSFPKLDHNTGLRAITQTPHLHQEPRDNRFIDHHLYYIYIKKTTFFGTFGLNLSFQKYPQFSIQITQVRNT